MCNFNEIKGKKEGKDWAQILKRKRPDLKIKTNPLTLILCGSKIEFGVGTNPDFEIQTNY